MKPLKYPHDKPLTGEALEELLKGYKMPQPDRDYFNIWTARSPSCCGQGDCNRCQFPHKRIPNQ